MRNRIRPALEGSETLLLSTPPIGICLRGYDHHLKSRRLNGWNIPLRAGCRAGCRNDGKLVRPVAKWVAGNAVCDILAFREKTALPSFRRRIALAILDLLDFSTLGMGRPLA
jgi:hypothetical protein